MTCNLSLRLGIISGGTRLGLLAQRSPRTDALRAGLRNDAEAQAPRIV